MVELLLSELCGFGKDVGFRVCYGVAEGVSIDDIAVWEYFRVGVGIVVGAAIREDICIDVSIFITVDVIIRE